MELKVSNKREKTKLVVFAMAIGFAVAFLSAPFLLDQVYGSTESQEKYPLAFDENGDKLDYNDCPGYDDGIDPSQYDSMSIQELEKITDDVDARITQLQSDKIAKPYDFNDDDQKELECLQSIRAVENEAVQNMAEITNDISEMTDLYSQQLDLNERWDSLTSKYND